MKPGFPSISIFIIALTCFLLDLDFKNWRAHERIIEHDVHSYYGYLPSIFIYDDLKLEKSDYRYGVYDYFFWPVQTSEGKSVAKMTCGLAILYSPFFAAGHLAAKLFDFPETGFSEPYKIFLLMSAIFYLILGLHYIARILRHFNFSDPVIGITILLLGLGTNLLCYSSQSATMSHVYSFSLIAVFIFHTIRYYETRRAFDILVAGLMFGLTTLIRPSNAVIIMFPLLYGATGLKNIPFLKTPVKHLLVFLVCTFLMILPQLLYWKVVTGHFIIYSYNEERFFFNNPRIFDGLFSFRKGWLIYTPMMGLSLAGIWFLKGKSQQTRLAIITFLVINFYIMFSWWCWWYGGSYGSRPMVDCYALLAIPLAAFVQKIHSMKIVVKSLFTAVCLFFMWLNIFQTYQYEGLTLHYDAMTRELYFKQFGKQDKIPDFDSYLDYTDAKKARRGEGE